MESPATSDSLEAPAPAVTVWTPEELRELGESIPARMEAAAEIIANGGRMRAAAEGAGVDYGTLWRWCNGTNDEHIRFQEYCVQLRRSQRQDRLAKRELVMRTALDIMADVLSGKLPADDDRAVTASRILDATEWRVYGDTGDTLGAIVGRGRQ